jgi:hypothetical protein
MIQLESLKKLAHFSRKEPDSSKVISTGKVDDIPAAQTADKNWCKKLTLPTIITYAGFCTTYYLLYLLIKIKEKLTAKIFASRELLIGLAN